MGSQSHLALSIRDSISQCHHIKRPEGFQSPLAELFSHRLCQIVALMLLQRTVGVGFRR